MNFGSFDLNCFMDQRLKIGLYFMVLAVVALPIALLLRGNNGTVNTALLGFTMFLELIGLIFVLMSIFNKRKSKFKNHD